MEDLLIVPTENATAEAPPFGPFDEDRLWTVIAATTRRRPTR